MEPAHAQAVAQQQVAGPAASGLGSAERRTVRRCLLVLGTLSTGNLIGVMSSLYLAVHYPLLLVAISPLGRHLLLVAPSVDPVAFMTVAVVRRTVFVVACFFLGRALGPTAVLWLGARAPSARRLYGWFERFFARASAVAILMFPGPAMSAVAGGAGMRPARFLPLVVGGLVMRMLLVLEVGAWFQGPIERVLAAIEQHWVGGTILMVLGIVLYQWYRGAERQPTSPR